MLRRMGTSYDVLSTDSGLTSIQERMRRSAVDRSSYEWITAIHQGRFDTNKFLVAYPAWVLRSHFGSRSRTALYRGNAERERSLLNYIKE